jgi:hypothetical protein
LDMIQVRTLGNDGFVDISCTEGGLEIVPAASNHVFVRGGKR